LHKEQYPIAAPPLARRALELFHVADRALIDFANHVPGLDADLIGWAPWLHFNHQDAFRGTQPQAARRFRRNSLNTQSQLRIARFDLLVGINLVGELANPDADTCSFLSRNIFSVTFCPGAYPRSRWKIMTLGHQRR
jgi:hypothetical protein